MPNLSHFHLYTQVKVQLSQHLHRKSSSRDHHTAQVHDVPLPRICMDEDVAKSQPHCCMCKGENYGVGYLEIGAYII